MATGDIVAFYSFKEGQLNAGAFANLPADLVDDDIRCALVDVTISPDAAVHDFWSDLQTNECTGNNYTAGGFVMTTMSIAEATGTVTWDADNATWAQDGSGFNDAYWGILYVYNATAANAPLIAYVELTGPKSNQGGSFTIAWHNNGIMTLA